jgi:hypothetical protein
MPRGLQRTALSAALAVALGALWTRSAGPVVQPAPAAAAETRVVPNLPADPVVPASPRAQVNDSAIAMKKWLATDIPKAAHRDLFAVNLDYFPIAAANSRTSAAISQQTKSGTSPADQEEKRQNLIQNLRQQAAGLRLQSTVMGRSPTALINGALVGEGSVVACGSGLTRTEFRVLRIESRRIIVEREGIKLDIPMK